MNTPAISIDEAIVGTLSEAAICGHVSSVHKDAVYLDMQTSGLIVLVKQSVGNGPGFVLLDNSVSFEDHCVPAQYVDAISEKINIESGRFTIDMRRASIWSPTLPGSLESAFHAGEQIEKNMGAVWNQKPANSITEILKQRAGALGDAILDADKRKITAAVQSLIGLGEGLTPSGDDILVGLLAVLRCSPSAISSGILNELNGMVMELPGKTTPVSAHFLRAGAEGRFTERLLDLLHAICRGDEKKLAVAVARVLQYGASSGMDLLRGIILGLGIVSGR